MPPSGYLLPMRCMIVIPARMGSTRFPGKPLCDLLGKPMVQWVYEAAHQAGVLQTGVLQTWVLQTGVANAFEKARASVDQG